MTDRVPEVLGYLGWKNSSIRGFLLIYCPLDTSSPSKFGARPRDFLYSALAVLVRVFYKITFYSYALKPARIAAP